MKVICSILIILGTGERQYLQLQGTEVKERYDDLYVYFPTLEHPPQTRWVNNNDCQYLDMKASEIQEFEDLKKYWKKIQEDDRKKWEDYWKTQK
jgi:pyruvate/2-oxoacid:ferredoxin oxidoreductase beta subunit